MADNHIYPNSPNIIERFVKVRNAESEWLNQDEKIQDTQLQSYQTALTRPFGFNDPHVVYYDKIIIGGRLLL